MGAPRQLVSLLAAALSACTPFMPVWQLDASADGGAPDGGPEPGADAGVDPWPCDGGPCQVEDIIVHRTLPLAVLPQGNFVYWSEFGPDNRGIDGSINRLLRGATCTSADAGCGTQLTPSLLANIAPQWLVSDGVDLCWIAYYWDRSNIACFDLRAGGTRFISQDEPYPVALALFGGELVWARLNVPSSSTNGAIVAKPRDGGALRTLVSGRRRVYDVVAAGGTISWAEQIDGGSSIYSLDGGADLLSTRGGQLASLAADGRFLYFAGYDTGEVGRLPLGGGAVEVLSSSENHPLQLRVDAAHVYWLAFGSPPDGPDGALRGLLPDAGLPPRTYASGLHALSSFTLEAGFAWWAAQGTAAGNYEDGAIQRVRVR